ncbi:WD40 repeat domain-containing protein, partial [Candidatus Dependentiae bacterium]
SCRWNADGTYVAICGALGTGSKDVRIYTFTGGDTLTEAATAALNDSVVRCVAWHPQSSFLAFGLHGDGGSNYDRLQVLSFDGSSLTAVDSVDFAFNVIELAWSSDGRHLAVVGDGGTNNLRLYSFDGQSLTEVTDAQKAYVAQLNSVAFNPQETVLATCGASGQFECYEVGRLITPNTVFF